MIGSNSKARRSPWIWLVRGLAVIGLCSVSALFIFPLWIRHQSIAHVMELRQKVPWPKIYRDCLAAGAAPISDAQFLAEANTAWLARLKDNTIGYQEQFIGHPANLKLSKVLRLATPQTPEAQQTFDLRPYEYDTRISALEAARLGLKTYVIVNVATPGGVESTHGFRYDSCGVKF